MRRRHVCDLVNIVNKEYHSRNRDFVDALAIWNNPKWVSFYSNI